MTVGQSGTPCASGYTVIELIVVMGLVVVFMGGYFTGRESGIDRSRVSIVARNHEIEGDVASASGASPGSSSRTARRNSGPATRRSWPCLLGSPSTCCRA